MSNPETYAEALEEIQRLRALGDRLAGALELMTTEMHTPVGASRASVVDGKYFLCLLESTGQLDALAGPIHTWLVETGMSADELRRIKAEFARRVVESR